MAEESLSLDEDKLNDVNNTSQSPKMTPNSTMITPSNAKQLKGQLFELFKEADLDNNQLFSFDEFSSVINKFLPNAKPDQIQAMFDTLDANHDQQISYEEFLDDTNFNRFLE